MLRKNRVGGATSVLVLLFVTTMAPYAAQALQLGEGVEAIATRLEQEQIKTGESEGSWPEEAEFTGSIAAGVARACELTCDESQGIAAVRAGLQILYSSQGNFYGDEAFALAALSEISADPCDNLWRTALQDFYWYIANDVNCVDGYISQYMEAEPSTAVFYLANHVVAAYYVDAEQKQTWRVALIDRLAQVDDSSDFPVMALGAATWALALTGPLDETPIDPNEEGASYWNFKRLADLPGLLLNHQVSSGWPYAGSFYWLFDHSDRGPGNESSGYTEETIFGTLGLIAASNADQGLDVDDAILAARTALLGGIEPDGKVYGHLWLQQGESYYAYGGEMLQVLNELVVPGDLNLDGGVDFGDFAMFANEWHAPACGPCSWCNGADLDHSGAVDFGDILVLADNWLEGVEPTG